MANPDEKKPDLKIEHCADAWKTLPSHYEATTEGIKPIVAAYHRNLARVHALTLFPMVLAHFVSDLTRITAGTYVEYKDQLASKKITHEELQEIILAKTEKDESYKQSQIKKAAEGDEKAERFMEEDRRLGINSVAGIFSGELAVGAHAWLSAQISGIWTAFEAMTEELWRATLNLHPEGLAELRGGKRGAGEDKKIDLSFLQRHNYNLSDKMGDVLSDKYSFDRLEEIRKAYEEAFYCDNQEIETIINDRCLDGLSLTRHVIVHNGGIIDEQFLRRKADLPEAILDEAGKPLPLDGEIVSTLIGPVVRRGWDLIGAVDDWIQSHER